MALYGEARDISLFRHINRELIHNIISQQCVLYKYDIEETPSKYSYMTKHEDYKPSRSK